MPCFGCYVCGLLERLFCVCVCAFCVCVHKKMGMAVEILHQKPKHKCVTPCEQIFTVLFPGFLLSDNGRYKQPTQSPKRLISSQTH